MSITLKKANGDIVHKESDGRPYYIEGIEKLSQDVADVVMTVYVADRNWGSQLTELIGKAIQPGTLEPIGEAFIQNAVEDAIKRLIAKQNERPDQLSTYEAIEDANVEVFRMGVSSYTFILEVRPMNGPDQDPMAFQVKLGHQIMDTAKDNLPGMSNL